MLFEWRARACACVCMHSKMCVGSTARTSVRSPGKWTLDRTPQPVSVSICVCEALCLRLSVSGGTDSIDRVRKATLDTPTKAHTRRGRPSRAGGDVKLGRDDDEWYMRGWQRRPEADSIHGHFASHNPGSCRPLPWRRLRRTTRETEVGGAG
jgi:hypothetical protein